MKKIITSLYLIVFCLTALQAQNADRTVQNIRKKYNNIKKQIAEMEKLKSSNTIYCMLLEDNVYDSRDAGERFHNEKTKFYYAYDDERELQLQMVIEEIVFGIFSTYRETMYINGEIALIYEKDTEEIGKHLYYNGNTLIRFTENNVEKKFSEEPEDAVKMRSNAHYIKETFFRLKKWRLNTANVSWK